MKIQIYHIPNAKEASKYPFSNNNGSPTRGQKMEGNGRNWGKRGEKFARRAKPTYTHAGDRSIKAIGFRSRSAKKKRAFAMRDYVE